MLALDEVTRLVDASKEGRVSERAKGTQFNGAKGRSRKNEAGACFKNAHCVRA
jgi:hypothetical protein